MFGIMLLLRLFSQLLFALLGRSTGFAEETLKLLQTFISQYPADCLTFVIERRIRIQQVYPATAGSAFGIRYTEHHPAGATMYHGTGAHGAGLFGDVNSATLKTPISHGSFCRSQRKHFRVRSSILEGFYLIPSAGDDSAIFDDDAPTGNFADRAGFFSLAHGQQHKLFVLRQTE